MLFGQVWQIAPGGERARAIRLGEGSAMCFTHRAYKNLPATEQPCAVGELRPRRGDRPAPSERGGSDARLTRPEDMAAAPGDCRPGDCRHDRPGECPEQPQSRLR